jgi:hypothetical protein
MKELLGAGESDGTPSASAQDRLPNEGATRAA